MPGVLTGQRDPSHHEEKNPEVKTELKGSWWGDSKQTVEHAGKEAKTEPQRNLSAGHIIVDMVVLSDSELQNHVITMGLITGSKQLHWTSNVYSAPICWEVSAYTVRHI